MHLFFNPSFAEVDRVVHRDSRIVSIHDVELSELPVKRYARASLPLKAQSAMSWLCRLAWALGAFARHGLASSFGLFLWVRHSLRSSSCGTNCRSASTRTLSMHLVCAASMWQGRTTLAQAWVFIRVADGSL